MAGAVPGAAQMRRSEEDEARRRAARDEPGDPADPADPAYVAGVHRPAPVYSVEPEKRSLPPDPVTPRVEPTRATELRRRTGLRLEPRVHGNGFVQLVLGPDGTRRLHVFGHPDTPRQTSNTPIHDHIFGLWSEVLVGRIHNTIWSARPRDEAPERASHTVYAARYLAGTADSVLETTGGLVYASVEGHSAFGEGCRRRSYQVEARTYHSTVADGPTATLMTKVAPARSPQAPRVLVPIGAQPDNGFSRHAHDPALLWRIIEEVAPRWYDLVET